MKVGELMLDDPAVAQRREAILRQTILSRKSHSVVCPEKGTGKINRAHFPSVELSHQVGVAVSLKGGRPLYSSANPFPPTWRET